MGDFVVSISYGNYLIQNGGTDKVIREHQELFTMRGIDYVFLFPVVRNIKVGKILKTFRYWGIDKNKDFLGLYKIKDVLGYIGTLMNQGNGCRALFIHHTWRVQEKDLELILRSFDVPIYYYLHDFYSICDGKNLIAQDGKYCGYGLDCFDCKTECQYYEQSQLNKKALTSLIKTFDSRLTFVAPSDNTKDIYTKTFEEYAERFISIPHQILQGEYKRKPFGNPIKIAFIGKQVSLKGWDDYKEIVDRLGDDPDYEFYYLGTGTDRPSNVKAAEVSVRKQGPDAMINTLRKLKIDIVLLLSCWPETYSYTYFEAYAAGCYIITYNCSGNMADMVNKNDNGFIIDNNDELISLLQDKNSMIRSMMDFRMKHPFFPLELRLNDEIASIALKSDGSFHMSDKKKKHVKRQLLAEAIYRLQNRNNLKKVKRSEN